MIAMLGTGTMGAPMARNLKAAGLEVRAFNRTREKADPLAGEGIEVAGSPEEAVRGADIVITMVSDGDAVTAAMEDGGALATMPDGALWLQMSTVGIAATEALAALAEERSVPFVDAPVLGTKEPAEQGKLQVLASGPDDQRERCAPVFDAVGASTRWLGEAGAGTRAKLVLNSWLLSLTESVAETVAFAESIDVDPRVFLQTIEGGSLDCAYAQTKGDAMIERSFTSSFSLSLARKDAGLVLEAAERHQQAVPLVEVVQRQMASAEADGHGDEDMAATYRASGRDSRQPTRGG